MRLRKERGFVNEEEYGTLDVGVGILEHWSEAYSLEVKVEDI